MNKFLSLILAGVLCTSNVLAQSFKTYYNDADGLKKEQLKHTLGKLMNKHTVFSYSSLWDHYPYTDGCLDNENQVFDMYSTGEFFFSKSPTTMMNKEHVVPQSWWGKGAKYGIYTDLFNVYPSEQRANSAKSNYPVGIVDGQVSFKNERCKVGTSKNSGGAGKVFEPCDEFKGDFARIYFYDATTYANVNWESNAAAFHKGVNAYPTLEDWIIPILLEWNRMDPPSEWEKVRNERVLAEQGNRNAFIDFPQLAEYIWGDSIDYTWNLAEAVPYSINGTTSGNIDDPFIDPTPDPDPEPGPTPGPVDEIEKKGIIFDYDFSDITEGKNTTSGGANTPWNEANDFIVSMNTCYKAGGAVKLGTGSKSGSITTVPVNAEAGSALIIDIEVKGWSKVEGKLLVSIDGAEAQPIEYSATMNDAFEVCTVTFTDIPKANPSVTIATSDKRAFVNAIRVYEAAPRTTGIESTERSNRSAVMYNLSGQKVNGNYKGIVINNGKKVIVK